MRILFVLTCCIALASVARAADQDQDNNHKKKHAEQASQAPQQQVVTPKGHKTTNTSQLQNQHNLVTPQGHKTTNTSQLQNQHNLVTPKGHKMTNTSQPQNQQNLSRPPSHNVHAKKGDNEDHGIHGGAASVAHTQTFHAKHFDLANKPNSSIPNVKFRANHRIEGSQNWQGANYAAFRDYRCEWHERDWWRSHHTRIVFVFGGPYFWDAGYWYPAWGYEPNAFYAYDGPIYAGNADMDPGQVVANVQAALQAQGYYHGEVDGILGPLTRGALLRYQEAHGLYPTQAIDEPTLESLGMA